MAEKLVVALGGNAILSTDASAKAQQYALQQTAQHLVALVEQGHELIVSHGNGPQVGNLLLQQQSDASEKNPAMPLDTCVAMTQGSIGYWLANALTNELATRQIDKEVATVVTQVVVDEADPAFKQPTKPIGPFFTQAEAQIISEQTGAIFKEDAGRGWRKVVASPQPIDIVEKASIDLLVNAGVLTIACGGGGIPVIAPSLQGVEAVIDKDFASEKLAELIDADTLVILTAVDHVFIHYGQANEEKLGEVTVTQLKEYVQANHFAAGSMLPKVEAAMAFVESKKGRKAVITSLDNLQNLGQRGIVGTTIISG